MVALVYFGLCGNFHYKKRSKFLVSLPELPVNLMMSLLAMSLFYGVYIVIMEEVWCIYFLKECHFLVKGSVAHTSVTGRAESGHVMLIG